MCQNMLQNVWSSYRTSSIAIPRRIFSKMSLESIRNGLGLVDWEEILFLYDVSICYNKFVERNEI